MFPDEGHPINGSFVAPLRRPPFSALVYLPPARTHQLHPTPTSWQRRPEEPPTRALHTAHPALDDDTSPLKTPRVEVSGMNNTYKRQVAS
jgi:hypothetical protein